MYKKEFDNHIRNKTLSNSFVFFGESAFLIDMYTQMLSNIEDSNKLLLYHDEYDFSTAKAHLSQGSLFGGCNVLVIKSEKKIPKKELDTLLSICYKQSENLFIYAYYGSDHKSYNNAKSFTKTKTMSVRFFHPTEYESQNILFQIANEKKIQIEKYTLAHLLKIHNNDIALAANELEKLSILEGEITNKDIDRLVDGLGEITLEEFTEKLINKKDFEHDLEQLLLQGHDPIKIVTFVTSTLTQLYLFNIYIRTHGAPNALDILGYKAPKFVVDKKAALAIKIKQPAYYKLHRLLLESELTMKHAHVDKEAILIATLIKFQKNLT